MATMTEVINHFDLPNEIKELRGSFVYRFFEPLENIEEDSRFANNDEDEPRYIKISWKNNSQIFSGLGISKSELVHKENLFFPSDINSGFSALSSDEAEVSASQDFVISDNTSVGSKLEYLLETVASNKFTEELEKNIDNSESSRIPVLDRTTNRPIVQANSVAKHGQAPDMLVRNANISQLVESSINSPLSGGVYDDMLESTKSISKKAKSELESRENQRLLTTFFYSIQKLSFPNPDGSFTTRQLSVSRNTPNSQELDDWRLSGFCIFKYRVEENKQTFLYARTIFANEFRDPYVAYGKTYRYEIRPVFCKYVSNETDTVIFLGSDESSFIDVECLENKAPSPPKNVKFDYIMNGNIEINWQRPESYVTDMSMNKQGKLEDKTWDTDDIKGYQLFYRHSLQEPFQLYRYFTFNNTVPTSYREKASELVSDDLIISSEYEIPEPYDAKNPVRFYEFTRYGFEIRSNTDYYFALCSIDAHGNSSNYSNQYKIRRDNVTGEVDIQLASVEGAPKQYPNLLLSGELVEPAMKVSGYQYLDVHFAPDTTASIPNRNEAATVLQLFELETQIEKKITITINET
jgi:hypothetical protein